MAKNYINYHLCVSEKYKIGPHLDELFAKSPRNNVENLNLKNSIIKKMNSRQREGETAKIKWMTIFGVSRENSLKRSS